MRGSKKRRQVRDDMDADFMDEQSRLGMLRSRVRVARRLSTKTHGWRFKVELSKDQPMMPSSAPRAVGPNPGVGLKWCGTIFNTRVQCHRVTTRFPRAVPHFHYLTFELQGCIWIVYILVIFRSQFDADDKTMDDDTRSYYERKSKQYREELKSWEHAWLKDNGTKPSRSDIKNNPDIGRPIQSRCLCKILTFE